MTRARITALSAALVSAATCTPATPVGRSRMTLLGDPALLARIRSFHLEVWDSAAACNGSRLVAGSARRIPVAPADFAADAAFTIDVPSGQRTLFLRGYVDRAETQLLATGCTSILLNGTALSVTIDMASAASDGGIAPEAGPRDASLPADGPPSDTVGPPANDTCAAPQPLALVGSAGSATGTLVWAHDDSAGSCGGAGGPDVVYALTLVTAQRVQASVQPSSGGFAPILYLESACGASASEPTDGCAAVGSSGRATLDAPDVPAGTWYLWVDSASGSPSSFFLTVNLLPPVPPPSNETCATAQPLTLGAPPLAGNTTGAPSTYHPACALPTDSRDVTYSFLLPTSSSVLIDRSASTYPAVTDLRPGATCAMDGLSLACAAGEYVYCPALPAGTYDLIVDGIAGAFGTFGVAVSSGPPRSPNDYEVLSTAPAFGSILGGCGATQVINDRSPTYGKTGTVVLPFAFTYFGTQYPAGTSLTVYQEGYLSFDTGVADTPQSTCLPAAGVPPDSILPFWTRLASRSRPWRGSVWATTGGTAPDRTLTVEWSQMDGLASDLTTPENVSLAFQVLLYEPTGNIEFRYSPSYENQAGAGSTVDPGFAVGSHATIGLQSGGSGVLVDQESCNPGAPAIGSCNDSIAPSPCVATTGYLFIPPTGSCP